MAQRRIGATLCSPLHSEIRNFETQTAFDSAIFFKVEWWPNAESNCGLIHVKDMFCH